MKSLKTTPRIRSLFRTGIIGLGLLSLPACNQNKPEEAAPAESTVPTPKGNAADGQAKQPGADAAPRTVDPSVAEPYDLVILGGRVIDPETQLNAIRNVGISGGKIVAVTDKKIAGKESIDASGHVVAPGFIDTHSHNAAIPFGQRLALRDGVTTPMELEVGVYPVADWYAGLEGKSRTNFGATVGTLPSRETAFNPDFKTEFHGDIVYDMQHPEETHSSMKWSTHIASPEELQRIRSMLEQGIKEGALGVGHVPGYMVAGVTQSESNMAQELAGKHGVFTALHGRYSSQMPPTSALLGFAELMGPQEVYGGGLIIQHLTAQALSQTPEALQMIDTARARGVQIIGEIYPYNFGGTIVGADYLKPDNYQRNMGRDYGDIIETSTMKPLDKARYQHLIKTAPATSVMFYNADEKTVFDALAHPSTILGSDAFIFSLKDGSGPALDWETPFDAVTGHPRGAGAHARLLRLVREKKVDIPLALAVSKMTYMPAAFLEANGVPAMAKKGRIQVGADADITVFNAETVADTSTMQHGGLPSTGIPYVVVSGTVVVKESKALPDLFPGKPVRR